MFSNRPEIRRALPRACQIISFWKIEQETLTTIEQTTTVELKASNKKQTQQQSNWSNNSVIVVVFVELLLFIVQLLFITQTVFDFRGGCPGALGLGHRVLFYCWGHSFFSLFSCTHFSATKIHLLLD